MGGLNTYMDNADFTPLIDLCRLRGREVVVGRNQYFSRRDHIPPFAGYIQQGAVRYSFTDESGNVRTVGFAFDGDFVVDYSSFVSRRPSFLDVQAIRDTKIMAITYGQFKDFIDKDYSTQLYGRNIAEQIYRTVYERLLDLFLLSPQKRFVKVMSEYPYLSQRLSAKEIASFIGITPEAFCRMRRRML